MSVAVCILVFVGLPTVVIVPLGLQATFNRLDVIRDQRTTRRTLVASYVPTGITYAGGNAHIHRHDEMHNGGAL